MQDAITTPFGSSRDPLEVSRRCPWVRGQSAQSRHRALRTSRTSSDESMQSMMVHLDEPHDDPVAPSGHTESSPLITPELALVCPETRALAIAMLPERDPDGWMPKREAPFPVERM